jgi:hypothetical protein
MAEVNLHWMSAWLASLEDTLQGRLERVRRGYRPEHGLILTVGWAAGDALMTDEGPNAAIYVITVHDGGGGIASS